MTRRRRIQWFGGAGVLVLVGVVCALTIGGEVGAVFALVLISLGLMAAVALVFYEVGLSEDRERAREAAERARPERTPARPRRSQLGRMRGERRRLR